MVPWRKFASFLLLVLSSFFLGIPTVTLKRIHSCEKSSKWNVCMILTEDSISVCLLFRAGSEFSRKLLVYLPVPVCDFFWRIRFGLKASVTHVSQHARSLTCFAAWWLPCHMENAIYIRNLCRHPDSLSFWNASPLLLHVLKSWVPDGTTVQGRRKGMSKQFVGQQWFNPRKQSIMYKNSLLGLIASSCIMLVPVFYDTGPLKIRLLVKRAAEWDFIPGSSHPCRPFSQ